MRARVKLMYNKKGDFYFIASTMSKLNINIPEIVEIKKAFDVFKLIKGMKNVLLVGTSKDNIVQIFKADEDTSDCMIIHSVYSLHDKKLKEVRFLDE